MESRWIRFAGALDVIRKAEIREAFGGHAAGDAVVDLSAVGYVDSTFVAELLRFVRIVEERGDGVVVVVPDNGLIRRVFSIVGVDRSVPLISPAGDVAAALRSVRGRRSEAG